MQGDQCLDGACYQTKVAAYIDREAKREKVQKARIAAFERIVSEAPAVFTAAQLRAFLKLVVLVDSYNLLEEVANHFAQDEDHDRSEGEIVTAALDDTADDKLTGFALRLVLTASLAKANTTR